MFVVTWTGPKLQVHYQRAINPKQGVEEWSWGPADGAFLVPCTERLALAMVTMAHASWKMEVHCGE